MTTTSLNRSPELMNRDDTALVVIDMQAKLVPLIDNHERITWNIRRLIDGGQILSVPMIATEQYPKGLGPILPELRERIPGDIPEKLCFSCGELGDLFTQLPSQGIRKLLVCGIETHVCIQQTVLDIIAAGFCAYVAVDAVGSRFPLDKEVALRRMECSGATLTTTEAALFEWCERAGTPEFKAISKLIRESAPA